MLNRTVEFFVRGSGNYPVKDFLNACQNKQQVKILRLLKHLEEFGQTSAIPNTKKLKGTSLWELRILGKDNIRIFYAPLGKNRVVILHAFFKKKQKTSSKEIKIALNRYQLLLDK